MTMELNAADNEKRSIKYVYIEMIMDKDSKYDVISGLFKGIIERDGDKFILLHGPKEAVNVLNTRFYNIMSIEELDSEYKNMTYLTSEENDQKEAIKKVEELYDLLILSDYGLKNDQRIINVIKYTDVPKEYIDGEPVKTTDLYSAPKNNNSVITYPPVVSYNYNNNVNANVNKTAVKKEPEPTLFGRALSKRPTKSMLDIMESKIEQIMSKTYVHELPKIDFVEIDDDDDDDKTKVSESLSKRYIYDDDNDFYDGFGLC